MISKIAVSFTKTAEIPVMPLEAFKLLKPLFPDHYSFQKDEPPEFLYGAECVADVEYISELLLPFGCFEVVIKGIAPGTMRVKMKDRIEKLVGEGVLEEVHQYLRGGIVQVTIPDLGLLLIDEVDWIENACTQELQSRLNEGWRILAVCPPNEQRRPDYILGRRKRS